MRRTRHKIYGTRLGGLLRGAPVWHANTWAYDTSPEGTPRLVVAPRDRFLEHLHALASELAGPLQLVYELHYPRVDGQPGRYSSAPMNHLEVGELFTRFAAFLEQDPRHMLWLIGSADDEAIEYDEHNQLYCYGPLDRYRRVLTERGLVEGDISLPYPHMSIYHESFDADERELLALPGWTRSELPEDDDRGARD